MTEFAITDTSAQRARFRFTEAHNLVQAPRFADALAGEFQPRCDPHFRMHTLGRLATAVFEKGEKEAPRGLLRSRAAQRIACLYRPSWAPTITARGIATTRGPILHLDAVRLEAPDGSFLEVSDQTGMIVPQFIVESTDVPLKSFDVPADEQAYIRKYVANAAETFFNTHC